MNMKKMKVMYNRYAKGEAIKIGDTEIETVDKHIYLDQLINMQSGKTEKVSRRIAAGWTACVQ